MNAIDRSITAETATERAWARLYGRVSTLQGIIAACDADMYAMGLGYPHTTFPEQHMLEAADKLEALAALARSMVANAEAARTGAAA